MKCAHRHSHTLRYVAVTWTYNNLSFIRLLGVLNVHDKSIGDMQQKQQMKKKNLPEKEPLIQWPIYAKWVLQFNLTCQEEL